MGNFFGSGIELMTGVAVHGGFGEFGSEIEVGGGEVSEESKIG